jgi:hypothetical protein
MLVPVHDIDVQVRLKATEISCMLLSTKPISLLYSIYTWYKYSVAPVSKGSMFQGLPRLCETVDNTERYI